MTKWEYWVATFDVNQESEDYNERLRGFLSDRGTEGWELVSIIRKTVENQIATLDIYTMFFKRPK